jgi:amino acid adenylation domain-containing protein
MEGDSAREGAVSGEETDVVPKNMPEDLIVVGKNSTEKPVANICLSSVRSKSSWRQLTAPSARFGPCVTQVAKIGDGIGEIGSTDMSHSTIAGFVDVAARSPHRTAVRLGGHDYSYGELHQLASGIARTICSRREGLPEPLVAVFANRTFSAFAGVIGALLSGAGYLPINPSFPSERVRYMLQKTGCRTIIAEPVSLGLLAAALRGIKHRYCIIVPEEGYSTADEAAVADNLLIGPHDVPAGDFRSAPFVPPNDLAYVMFTSGSTGIPKGVMTTHANVRWIINVLNERYHITPDDRLSLNADMTFSASVLVLFLAFSAGAAVCCPTKKDLLNPAAYIVKEGITVWKCVPSLAVFMDKLRQLRDGTFPTVRITTFGGEAVPGDIVERWSRAAPRSIIENVYGATEMSVNTTYYVWDAQRSPLEAIRGSLPIGSPLPGVTVSIVDEELREVEPGETGELLASGPLVTAGYLGDEEKTLSSYITLPGRDGRFFRTGDIVRRPRAHEPIVYIGRRDNQIKVLGNRIELGEVEAISRQALGTQEIAALGWPPSPRGFDGMELFVGGLSGTEAGMYRILREHLPPYMLPRRVRLVDRLPLNPSGKIDRLALRSLLESDYP